jgi:hypothetical protein
MTEIFDLIHSVNRLNGKVDELNSRLEFLFKYPSIVAFSGYIGEREASEVLHLSVRELRKMRCNGEIPFARFHRKIMYKASDLQDYLERMTSISPPER